MDWGNVALSLGMLLLGALFGWWITKRLASCRLDAIVLQDVVLLDAIDPDVREVLRISYGDNVVEDITMIELMVANRGNNPIEPPIKPLLLTVDLTASRSEAASSWDLLDVSASSASREDIGVRIEPGEVPHQRRVLFDLLNPNEYFTLKVLLSGVYSARALSLSITAPRLPHELRLIDRQVVRPRFERLTDALRVSTMLLPVVALMFALGAGVSQTWRIGALMIGVLPFPAVLWLVSRLEKAILARDPIGAELSSRRARERERSRRKAA